MAVVGEALLNPESGWQRIDDKDEIFKYTGTWNENVHSRYFNGGQRYVDGGKGDVSFSFYGTNIRIIGEAYAEVSTLGEDNVVIEIDGVTFSFSVNLGSESSGITQCILFEHTLEKGTHNVKIYPSTTGRRFNFDAIDIMTKSLNKILLLSSGKTYSFEKGKYSDNLIPKMTSKTSPSGTVSSSGEYSTTSLFDYLAFDGNIGTRWASKTGDLGWIQYEFPKKERIVRYRILAFGGGGLNNTPKSWTFEGSNDGVNFDILDTRTNITTWVRDEFMTFDFINNTEYKIYRMNISDIQVRTNLYSTLYEIEMMKFSDSTLIDIPSHSEQNLIKYGMDSPAQVDGIFSNKNYILSEEDSKDVNGLWTTEINRKPLSIKFN